jgi:hypothetical protein
MTSGEQQVGTDGRDGDGVRAKTMPPLEAGAVKEPTMLDRRAAGCDDPGSRVLRCARVVRARPRLEERACATNGG